MKILNKLLGMVAVSLVAVTFCAGPAEAASKRVDARKATAVSAKSKTKAAPTRKHVTYVKGKRVAMLRQRVAHVAPEPEFNAEGDPILRSQAFLVQDQASGAVLLEKNSDAVLPIASITKLMTAMVVTEAGQDLSEPIEISDSDVEAVRGNRSRLKVGTRMTRGELLHLALMASENRAAHALGRQYPGGLSAFVSAMNDMATNLGMSDTRYVEPTGLSSQNQSSARDLSLLVKAAYQQPLIRQLSTMPEAAFDVGSRQVQFRNTNGLVRHPEWDIGLQKTGYISEAGRCVVMQAELAGRKLIMVLLDSAGKYSRIGDAERIRRWLTDASELLSQRR